MQAAELRVAMDGKSDGGAALSPTTVEAVLVVIATLTDVVHFEAPIGNLIQMRSAG